jgi:hypothetical protein
MGFTLKLDIICQQKSGIAAAFVHYNLGQSVGAMKLLFWIPEALPPDDTAIRRSSYFC